MTAPDPRLDVPFAYRPENKEAATDDLIRMLTETRGIEAEFPSGTEFEVKLPREAANMLLDRLEAQAGQITKVRELHQAEKRWLPYWDADRSYDTAEEASKDLGHTFTIDPSNMPYFEVCAHCKTVEDGPCEGECTKENGYRESLWPCPTIAALAPEGPET